MVAVCAANRQLEPKVMRILTVRIIVPLELSHLGADLRQFFQTLNLATLVNTLLRHRWCRRSQLHRTGIELCFAGLCN